MLNYINISRLVGSSDLIIFSKNYTILNYLRGVQPELGKEPRAGLEIKTSSYMAVSIAGHGEPMFNSEIKF